MNDYNVQIHFYFIFLFDFLLQLHLNIEASVKLSLLFRRINNKNVCDCKFENSKCGKT